MTWLPHRPPREPLSAPRGSGTSLVCPPGAARHGNHSVAAAELADLHPMAGCDALTGTAHMTLALLRALMGSVGVELVVALQRARGHHACSPLAGSTRTPAMR